MDLVGEQYYKLNRILLLCLGLWPFQNSVLKKTQIIFFETLFISFLLCQIKYIFNRVRYDWNMLKDQAELEIIRQYADDAKLYTTGFICLAVIVLLGLFIISCIPCVFDVIMPINESRPRQFPITVEYFIDKDTYFYAILTYMIITQFAGCFTIAAVATILIAYVLHTCAMFKIASYRMEHIFDGNVQRMPRNIKQYIIYDKLIHTIYIHHRALDLTNFMTNSFATFYFVLLGCGIAAISLTFVNFMNAVVLLDDKLRLLILSGIIFIQLYYTFLANYVGQNIIDTSLSVFRATYNIQWYAAPLWIQKMILFMMQRSSKMSTLTTGGLFVASLEGFATIMSMSISYVMLLQSVRIKQLREEL